MARFVKGDIVVVPFPFSSTTGEKRRPALVIASWRCLNTTDYLLCMISSQNVNEPYIMPLDQSDIAQGSFSYQSYLRPTYLFTVGERRITKKIAKLKEAKFQDVIANITRAIE